MTTGVKTSSPFAGETSRPRWPWPHGSENRAPLPLNPCRRGDPKYAHWYDEEQRRDGRGPGQERGDAPRPADRDADHEHCDQDDVGVARGDGEGQREAGPAGPRRILLRQREEEQRDAEEQDRGGMLPERLAGGPHRRAEREHRCRPGRLDVRMAASDEQEQDGRGGRR